MERLFHTEKGKDYVPMKKKEKGTKRGRLPAADLFLWLLLLLCIIGVGVRVVAGADGIFSRGEAGEYLISYLITDMRSEYSERFGEGTEFYLEDGTPFGVLSGEAVFTPTREYLENENGEYVVSYSSGNRVDVKGTVRASGAMTERGFMLEKKKYVAVNMPLTVHSAEISAEILITDISKVSVQN